LLVGEAAPLALDPTHIEDDVVGVQVGLALTVIALPEGANQSPTRVDVFYLTLVLDLAK